MNPIRYAAYALALGFLAPAWAINKCTGADGKVSFQDAPCAGQGEKIEVRPAMQGATPIPPNISNVREGAFGPSWQRKNYVQNQGIPQTRAELQRKEKECSAGSQEAVAHAGPLRRSTLASGTQFAQERAAADAASKAECDSQLRDLRDRLSGMEKEVAAP